MPHPSKTLSALLALILLVTACSLSPARAPGKQTPFPNPEPTSLTAPAQNTTAQGPTGFTGFLPLIQQPRLSPTPWPAVLSVQTRQVNDRNTDLNIDISERLPNLAGGNPADPRLLGFNQAVQALVEQNLREVSTWVGAPVKDPGGTVSIDYQIPSAVDWQFAQQANASATAGVQYALPQASLETGHSLLSTRLVMAVYLGGAHPNTTYYSLTYDLTTDKTLALDDLFKPGSDYLQALSSYCLKELRSRKNVHLFGEKAGTAPDPQNYAIWNVTADGLLITFNEYQVAVYAAGPQFVLVPYAHLKDLINPDGPLAQYAK